MRGALQTGARVFLRRPREGDRAAFLALHRVSRRFLAPWEPGGDPAARFDGMLKARRSRRHVRMLVCRVEDGALLGSMGINEIVRGAFHSAYLGYWIGAPHARQGYMTEALQLALRHAFRVLDLHRVEANIVPGNRPSLALVRRAGFRKEGLSRRYLEIAGRWQDHERWALLAEEWRPRPV